MHFLVISNIFFLHILCITIYLLLTTSNSNGTSGLSRNTSSRSKTVVLNIDDFGAKGDGITDASKTLHAVWKVACSLPWPAKIVIPAGNSYLVKPTDFAGPCQSKVTLRISDIIVAPHDREVWDGLDVHKWLYFHGVNHLTVEEGGIIDGMGQKWWAQSCKTNGSNPCTQAPTAITFHKCKNLKVRNVTLVSSQQMHMAFTNCMQVAASGLRVIAPADSPNTDGIHISASTHVQLKNAIVGTGDDCISIVSNSTRIRINNIICGPGHGISIGSLGKSKSSAAVQDVIVNRASLFNTENGVRIKTWRTLAVSIDSISFLAIKGTSATEEAIILSCSESHPCKRLYLENIQLVSGYKVILLGSIWHKLGSDISAFLHFTCRNYHSTES